MKTHSKTDWQRVQREARENVPILFDPETDPYDPNDPVAVAAFFAQATVRRPGQRGSGKKLRKVLLSVRYSAEVVDYFKATGEGWQVRMDEVLRDYVTQHRLA
ncbi:MAG: BrnA antitoxin family protein [Sulfuricellaceae bacterium]